LSFFAVFLSFFLPITRSSDSLVRFGALEPPDRPSSVGVLRLGFSGSQDQGSPHARQDEIEAQRTDAAPSLRRAQIQRRRQVSLYQEAVRLSQWSLALFLPCRPLSGTRLNNNTPGMSGRLLT